MNFSMKLWIFILSFFFGAFFFCFGSFLFHLNAPGWGEIERQEQILVVNASNLSTFPLRTKALLEGRVSKLNPLQFRSFVAYTRREYRGSECSPSDDGLECTDIWVYDESVTPPLWLDFSGGQVQLANNNYIIWVPSTTWQSTERLVENETKKYEGFEIGDPVLAVGHLVEAAERRAFQAQRLYNGNRDSYLAVESEKTRIISGLGTILMLIGGLIALFPVLLLMVESFLTRKRQAVDIG
jgi:hypothetical protein